jgi:hypothetical protein
MLRLLRINAVLVYILFAVPVAADPFVGLKLAPLDMDGNVADDPLNLAFDVGYALDTWVADLSLIAEFNRTLDSGTTRQGEDLELNANAVYLLWKTTRSMYVSLRTGVVENEIVEYAESRHKTGLLFGAGIGQVIGRTRLQIEYTSLAGDARFYGISLEFDL